MTSPNPILISNPVLQSPQEVTLKVQETTGEVLYANSFSGIGQVSMPQDFAEALNSDYGETGNNLILQLQQKIQQFPDGPWYVDSRDGCIYIHNRKLQEPPVADYYYQAENGELLNVAFETQYITKSLRASSSSGIDLNKGLTTDVLGFDQGSKISPNGYMDYYDPYTGAYKPQAAINAFSAGILTYQDILALNNRVKESRNTTVSSFTENQWKQIRAINNRNLRQRRKAQQDYTNEQYELYKAGEKANPYKNRIDYINRGLEETLQTQDLTDNVKEYLLQVSGSAEAASRCQMELEQAARDGTLDDLLKRRYSGLMYNFTKSRLSGDNGAVVWAWNTTTNATMHNGRLSTDDVDKNPYMKRLSSIKTDGTIDVFTKSPVEAQVSGYRLLRAYFTRKLGAQSIDKDLSRRVLAAANNSRKITERKLVAKATLIGRPSLRSSQVITLRNIGKKWSGNWYIKSCTHKIEGSSGYTTEVELINHSSIEGYAAAVESNSTGNNATARATGGEVTTKPITSINLTSYETVFFTGSNSARKEDLMILKLAGVQDAVVPKGEVGGYGKKKTLSYELVRVPTAAERAKYGRQAARAVSNNIKAGVRK